MGALRGRLLAHDRGCKGPLPGETRLCGLSTAARGRSEIGFAPSSKTLRAAEYAAAFRAGALVNGRPCDCRRRRHGLDRELPNYREACLLHLLARTTASRVEQPSAPNVP
jgi:hypothetical protein